MPKSLVDYFLPMEPQGPLVSEGIWGNPNVLPRDIKNGLEDPTVWHSGGMYHIVYNHWPTKTSHHFTSVDGIKDWTYRGIAFKKGETKIFRTTDGTVNDWEFIERPTAYVEDGHVTHFIFSVIDAHDPIIVASSDKDAFPAGKIVTDFVEFVAIAPIVLEPVLYHLTTDPHGVDNLAFHPVYQHVAQVMQKKLLDIVIGGNRVEVDWGVQADGTEVFRSHFAPGADDKKLKL